MILTHKIKFISTTFLGDWGSTWGWFLSEVLGLIGLAAHHHYGYLDSSKQFLVIVTSVNTKRSSGRKKIRNWFSGQFQNTCMMWQAYIFFKFISEFSYLKFTPVNWKLSNSLLIKCCININRCCSISGALGSVVIGSLCERHRMSVLTDVQCLWSNA